MSGWYGVDLDGTLAIYGGWKGVSHIGEPVPAMADRVRQWLAGGKEVRIFTARVDDVNQSPEEVAKAANEVQDWTQKHFGVRLKVTCRKDFSTIAIYDDRAVQVEMNTGRVIGGEER